MNALVASRSGPLQSRRLTLVRGRKLLSGKLDGSTISPQIDLLPSLSHVMNAGVAAGRTPVDHDSPADQPYGRYARGSQVRRLLSVLGQSGLPPEDGRSLAFAGSFERQLLSQSAARHTLEQMLELRRKLLATFPATELKRVTAQQLTAPTAPSSVRTMARGAETDAGRPDR